jgi:hypothetical protein
MTKWLLSAFFVVAALPASALIVSAQDTDTQPLIPCPPVPVNLDKEVLRVPKAAITKADNGDTVYLIMGNESWRRTEIEVKRGQTIEISADGIVRWAPDGIEKIDVTPDGTRPPYRDGWNYYHFPLPEAGIGSLVMRIGKGIYSIGSNRTLEAEDNGFIEFMVNDDKLDDNSGFFSVRVTLTDGTSLDPRTTAKKN